MALIKCDECGSEISSKSLFCPRCGYPTHLNTAHPDGREPEAFAALKKAVEASAPHTAPPVTPPQSGKEDDHTDADPASASADMPASADTPETDETPAEAEERLDEAIEAYEKTLEGGAESRRRNERTKVFVFLGVFLVLLGVVLYFYFTSPVEKIGEEAAEEEIDADASDTLIQSAAAMPIDSVVNPAAEKNYESATDTGAVIAPASVTHKPATGNAVRQVENDRTREIKVAPLSQQASHSTDNDNETPLQQ